MQTFRIENRTIFKILFSITIFIGLLNVAALVQTQLIWIASAFFLALAINPLVELVQRFMPKRSRGAALAVAMLIAFMAIFIIVYNFLPKLIDQTIELIDTLPQVVNEIQSLNSPIGRVFEKYNLESVLQNSANDIFKALAGATGSVISIAQGIFNGFAAAATILTLTVFMLIEGPKWNTMLWKYHPTRSKPRNQKLVSEMYLAVSSYFTGILTIAAISAIASSIMMSIVGIPYAIPLGLIVGLFGLIPFVGATIAAVIVVAIALFTSTGAAIALAIYFIIYQQVENNVIQPVIQGRSTELSPLVVTIAILLGASIAGLFGALVAIPVAACIKVILVHFYGPKLKEA